MSCCEPETSPPVKPPPVASNCCAGEAPPVQTSCCAPEASDTTGAQSPAKRRDWLLIISAALIVAGYALHLGLSASGTHLPVIGAFAMGVHHVVNIIWWGIALGIVMVGLLSRVPREFVVATLGPPGTQGIVRAACAGVMLDLCSHGILMVAAKLYERGASTGQMIAFLIASPWNSLSLTLILVALVGLPWTLAFIGLSMIVAIATGLGFDALVRRGSLPPNPNQTDLPADFRFWPAARAGMREADWSPAAWLAMLKAGFTDSRMVMRWILFGIVLAALIRTMFDAEAFGTWFGPTLTGLALTLVGATLMEVCSEGSVPIAGDLFTRARAPGNAFAFLMAGVSTDYTEMLVLRGLARSWKFALMLPLLTLPQIIGLGLLLNQLGP